MKLNENIINPVVESLTRALQCCFGDEEKNFLGRKQKLFIILVVYDSRFTVILFGLSPNQSFTESSTIIHDIR